MAIHKKTIGILGGGQLARMLALKARQMGLQTIILCQKMDEPAALVASKVIIGSLKSEKDLKKLIRSADLITFESEFIPAALLKKCLKNIPGKKIAPSLKALGGLQDRLLQKEWLCDFDIPTLDHVKINSKEDMSLAFHAFDQKIVFKRRLGGYDGYGTFIIKSQAELDHFKTTFKGQESQFIIEPFRVFKSEKSLIFARNAVGDITVLPMITSVQKNNQCDYVFGPSTHPLQAKLTEKIKSFLKQIDYVGVIAFELFDFGSELVVNEIAPRVHNTGHFSQEALNVDQFELHLRCLLGLTLPTIQLKQPAFVMVNLLGQTLRQPSIQKFPTGSLHWYEKLENRPRRKMGHINYIGENQTQLLALALKERKGILL
jgi:5-(carboxyamino)imidazole ribonucleotide synthase